MLPAAASGRRSWYFRQNYVPVQACLADFSQTGRVRCSFCRHGIIIIVCRRDGGTNLLSGYELLPVDKVDKGHWRSIAVQIWTKAEIYLGTVFKLHAAERIRVHCLAVFILFAQFAKTVTNNLPLLSVLVLVVC